MKRSHVYIGGLVVFVLAITLLVLFQSESPTVLFENAFTPSETQLKAQRLRLHPLTSETARAAAKKMPAETWEEWVNAKTAIVVGLLVEHNPELDTLEEIEAQRVEVHAGWTKIAAPFKVVQDVPPRPGEPLPIDKLPTAKPVVVHPPRYEGPQTVVALMASFDEKYVENYPHSLDWESQYPKEKFIQQLLDRGVSLEDSNDYNIYLNLRGWFIAAEPRPDLWTKGYAGVPPTDHFEEFKNGLIDRHVWMQETFRGVQAADSEVHGLFFFDDRPEAYLPMKANLLHVHRDGAGTKMWGELLTEDQENDLIYHGIHPAGIEIVYVDENYNVLSEKPAPYDPETDGVVSSQSRPITPEAYEEIFGEPMPEMDIESGTHFFGDTEGFGTSTFDTERAKQAEAEWKKMLTELEALMNMTDDEIEAELEKQATSQVPTDERLETELQEQVDPQRFSKAMATLRQYGREEGLRRLAEKDPAFAEQLQGFLDRQRK